MKKRIAILSYHSGRVERGVENWASEIKTRLESDEFNLEIINNNYLLKIRKILDSDILIPTNGRFQVLFIKIISIFFNKKLLIFGHSGPGADDKWNLLMKPDIFVAFSDYQKEWAENNNIFNSKIIKINHAIDINKFKPAKIKPKNTVICVAADVVSKRVDLVRKAVSKLKNVKLLVAGKGQDLEISYKKMPDFYKRGSIFAFVPQSWEAFGLVYLEALATNLPVVTINDPVRREIVGDAGILVKNVESIGDLSKAIKNALSKNWDNKPRKQAEKFSWNKTVSKYEELFKQI